MSSPRSMLGTNCLSPENLCPALCQNFDLCLAVAVGSGVEGEGNCRDPNAIDSYSQKQQSYGTADIETGEWWLPHVGAFFVQYQAKSMITYSMWKVLLLEFVCSSSECMGSFSEGQVNVCLTHCINLGHIHCFPRRQSQSKHPDLLKVISLTPTFLVLGRGMICRYIHWYWALHLCLLIGCILLKWPPPSVANRSFLNGGLKIHLTNSIRTNFYTRLLGIMLIY